MPPIELRADRLQLTVRGPATALVAMTSTVDVADAVRFVGTGESASFTITRVSDLRLDLMITPGHSAGWFFLSAMVPRVERCTILFTVSDELSA